MTTTIADKQYDETYVLLSTNLHTNVYIWSLCCTWRIIYSCKMGMSDLPDMYA